MHRVRKLSVPTPEGSPSPTGSLKAYTGTPSPTRSHNTWQHNVELSPQTKEDVKYLSADQLWVDNAVKVGSCGALSQHNFHCHDNILTSQANSAVQKKPSNNDNWPF